MQRVAFAGELAGEVRIAFPVTEIGALYGAIAAGGKTTVRQSVGQNVTGHFLQFGAASEISTPMRRVAPRSVLGPVPGRHPQFSVIAVSDGSPARRQRLLDNVWRVDLIDVGTRQHINRTTEGAVGIKRIDGVACC